MHMRTRLIFWPHLFLIICSWLSPILFDWRWIVFGVAVLSLQFIFLGGCYLTILEGGKEKYETFYHLHLQKYFPVLKNKKKEIWLFIRMGLPIFLILMGYIVQEFFHTPPLLF